VDYACHKVYLFEQSDCYSGHCFRLHPLRLSWLSGLFAYQKSIRRPAVSDAFIANIIAAFVGGTILGASILPFKFFTHSTESAVLREWICKNRPRSPLRELMLNLTSELDDSGVDIRFIGRGGVWYFADFGFLGWDLISIVQFVGGLLIAISFATGVLILRRRLSKQGRLNGANLIKIFIPIFWPKLFSETRG
jgi:hypothetical protein